MTETKMTDVEATRYSQLLLTGKLKLANPLEAKTLEMLQGCQAQMQQLIQKGQLLEAEIEKTKTAIIEARGQRNGFVSLLISAEESRRVVAAGTDTPLAEDPATGELVPLRTEPPINRDEEEEPEDDTSDQEQG